MFRVAAQTTRRFAFRAVKQARFYSAHPPSGAGSSSSLNKTALMLAAFTTVGAVYVSEGCPTLIKGKAAIGEFSEGAPSVGSSEQTQAVSEQSKEEDESPVSAQEEGAEPVNTPENEITYSEEKAGDLASKQEVQPEPEQPEQPEPEQAQPEQTDEPEQEGEQQEHSKAVLHESSPAEAEPIDEAELSAEEAKEVASISGGSTEQGTTATAAATGVKGEQKSEQQTAYNPETGEINWDCPCLGGMAYGPCGEEFKSAFSCFVYSEADPKGIDCVEKFSTMQTCFRKYPEYYAEQIKDEEEASAEASKQEDKTTTAASTATSTTEVQTENAVFEPVLEKYVEENPQLEETPEAAPVTPTGGDKE
ncbi:unnamed protein product [Kluyveromyces dobzhanskii CBS 2104]|uniref:Mitochondrial intermembrane space import and assembly protein 40 n=1 Tax=Kluyveromyces dobzhanskii CBS 2104 TaxID=1427455 RepID=A0A0A8L372_9SACH|nr:unnamed protein product [Kluyveromyces dobzhanskii CBS 2104]